MKLERVENLISHVLRGGVLLSLLVILTGMVVTFVHHPGYAWSPQEMGPLTAPGAQVPPTIGSVLAGVAAGHGQSMVLLGLLILIATPVVRVSVSVVVFLLQRDWAFVVITLLVLGALLFSFFSGRAE